MSAGAVVRAPGVVCVLAAVVSCIIPVDARAAWSRLSDVNLPIGSGTGQQVYPSILEDGAGGAFIAWHDNRGANYDIYIQRVSAAGAPLWTANGVAVCSATGDQANTQMVSDGAGGVIVAWHDFRAGNWNVYVQRLNANGLPQWTANGVALCTAAGNQQDPFLATDGQGGAIVAWPDQRSGSRWDIYARRVSSAGAPQWTADGVVVCDVPTVSRGALRLVSDGAGGAIMTWHDSRGTGTSYDIYAQRVNGSAAMQWPLNGVVVIGVNGWQAEPAIASDGAGGAFITWYDEFFGVSERDVRIQRMSPLGARLWDPSGVIVGGAQATQDGQQVIADGTGGAIVAWQDDRYATQGIFAQRVNSTGSTLWAVNGAGVGSALYTQSDPHLTSDGAGGAIITYRAIPAGTSGDLRAQRIPAGGFYAWASTGVLISSAVGAQSWPGIVADGAGGAIVTWHDDRSGTSTDVYAQRVDRYGYLGNVEPVVTSVRDVPNDQGGKAKVSWAASPLDADPDYTVTEYRLWRSVPAAVALGITGSRRARAMTHDPDIAATEGALLSMTFAATAYAWELVSFQPAAALPSYSMTAFTTGDSIPGSNPPTLFMVEARAGATVGSPHWFSSPDSGYSVDNLAPATPSALVGMYANGVTVLHWAANGEADLSSYRLYRGTSAGFTPSPANRIASPASTNYDDPSGVPSFYKLSAVDIHGNESGFALLTPSGTLDVPGGGVPVALRLGSLEPNPAEATTRIGFDLPRAAHVSLVVFDATGRAVRALVRGERPAGTFGMTWDLRDDAGRRVANGVYFVRLVCDGRTLTRRMVARR